LKIIKYLFLTIFAVLQLSQSGYGQVRYLTYPSGEYLQYVQSDYLAVNKKKGSHIFDGESEKEPDLESPLRRFEITFFISAPFVFILTFATLHTYDVIKKQSFNVNVWKDYKPSLLIGTFGISSAIAAREAWITGENNNKKREQILNEQTYYFYANKNF
jgi:hypothetical protein